MYNNKQVFVPPLVIYRIVYLTNMESFLYFLNKAYGQLGYHSALKIPFGRQCCMLPICDGLQLHIPCMQHKDLLLYDQQSLVK